MPWQEGPELLLWHQISSSFSAFSSSSWHQCHHPDPDPCKEVDTTDFQLLYFLINSKIKRSNTTKHVGFRVQKQIIWTINSMLSLLQISNEKSKNLCFNDKNTAENLNKYRHNDYTNRISSFLYANMLLKF